MGRQSWRTPELVRRTLCCGAEAGTENGRLWCMSCGQQVFRASDVFGAFKRHQFPPPPAAPPPAIGRRKGLVSDDQGNLL